MIKVVLFEYKSLIFYIVVWYDFLKLMDFVWMMIKRNFNF